MATQKGEPHAAAALPAGAGPAVAGRPEGLSLQARLGVLALVVCALAVLFWPRGSGRRDAPPGMLVDAGGRPVPLATRMQPVTLLHFWSTWCPPCIDEVPAILQLSRDFATEPGFAMVMVAVNDDVSNVKTFLGQEFPTSLFDPDWKVAHRYGTKKLPETHLIVRGQIVESFIGATDWNDPEIRGRLKAALAAARGAE